MKPFKKYTAYFERFEITMTGEQADDMSPPGEDASEAVKYWKSSIALPNADDIRAELEETGAWDAEELEDDQKNEERILWMAAGNIREEESQLRKY